MMQRSSLLPIQRALHFASEREARANSELAHVRADKQRLEALLQVSQRFVC